MRCKELFVLHYSKQLMICRSNLQGIIQKNIWAHRFFAKQKQTCQRHKKWQLEVLGALQASQWGLGGKALEKFGFFRLKHGKTAIVKVKKR